MKKFFLYINSLIFRLFQNIAVQFSNSFFLPVSLITSFFGYFGEFDFIIFILYSFIILYLYIVHIYQIFSESDLSQKQYLVHWFDKRCH